MCRKSLIVNFNQHHMTIYDNSYELQSTLRDYILAPFFYLIPTHTPNKKSMDISYPSVSQSVWLFELNPRMQMRIANKQKAFFCAYEA